MMRRLHAAWRTLMLAGLAACLPACGYHLVGGGPAGEAGGGGIGWLAGSTVAVSGDDAAMTRELREALARAGVRLAEGEAAADRHLRLHLAPAAMTPAAYDAAGVPVQYRLSLQGSLEVLARAHGEEGKGGIPEDGWRSIWRSGELAEAGDLYAAGGPASIEAARRRLERDLRAAWLRRALSRLRSGF